MTTVNLLPALLLFESCLLLQSFLVSRYARELVPQGCRVEARGSNVAPFQAGRGTTGAESCM